MADERLKLEALRLIHSAPRTNTELAELLGINRTYAAVITKEQREAGYTRSIRTGLDRHLVHIPTSKPMPSEFGHSFDLEMAKRRAAVKQFGALPIII